MKKVTSGLPEGTAKIYLVSVKDADDKYYAVNGAVAGTSEHWVEVIGDGASVEWNNLPAGTYTVTEKVEFADVPGYNLTSTTYQVGTDGTAAATPAQAEVEKDGEVTVIITNTYANDAINKDTVSR